MQQRFTTDSLGGDNEERAPFGQRLRRNQFGILVAVALTLAAASVLLARTQG